MLTIDLLNGNPEHDDELVSVRLTQPDSTIPAVDDRNNEHPADILRLRAEGDRNERSWLLESAKRLLSIPDQSLEIVQGIAYLATSVIPDVHPSLITWTLGNTEDEESDTTAAVVIDALVALQPTTSAPYLEIWKRLWRKCIRWSPALFKAIRVISPETAVQLIPELLERVPNTEQSPWRHVFQLRRSPEGTAALSEWLTDQSDAIRNEAIAEFSKYTHDIRFLTSLRRTRKRNLFDPQTPYAVVSLPRFDQ